MIDRRVALVTGGSKGIGKAIALRLARDGYDVTVNYRTDRQLAQDVVDEIEKIGKEAMAIKADVGNATDVDAMMKATLSGFGKVDVLVNNAGVEVGEPCPVMQLDERDWDAMFNVNVKGVFLCSKAAAPSMIRQRSGKIINISSTCGRIPSPYLVAYSSTKAAVIALTQGMAVELAPYSITVNAILPGGVDTDMNEYEFRALGKHLGKTAEEIRRANESSIPLGHRMAKPEEIASVAGFLASNDASYITGATITVSGGLIC
jgi:NAD(P)-dependent dehydrogenase (short-subunit alcohol dehydrogenase family)